MRSYFKVAVAIAACAIPSAVVAQAGEQAPQARVSYSDLDLSGEQGAEALAARVQAAAKSVCSRPIGHWVDRVKARSCERKAIEDAQVQIQVALRNANSSYAMTGQSKDIAVQ